ncbi:hypothetical protein LTR94_019098, partial [Friedmanniomyces endolithicus]
PNQPPATPEVARPSRAPGAGFGRPVGRDDDREKRFSDAGKAVSRTRGEPKRREGRMTIQSVVGDGDAAERMRSLASVRRAREREKEKRKGGSTDAPNRPREVVIPDVITVQELSNRMAVRGVDIIKFLMKQGMMMKINDVIDSDTAELVAEEFGMAVKRVSESDVETGFIAEADDEGATETRAPVVAIMGHVDHGKTSLLDALRTTDVAGGEAGGITQHIGAYQVRLEDGQKVTFLDTPGHAAFSAMRARGANVTDIVVLVVAADDGVMPQTIEAIQHAKAAEAPLIVAVNKMDKPGATSQKVVNELLQYEVIAESLGGDTQIIEVSAKERMNLDGLLEAILVQAEVMDLRANPDRSAEGVVIEAKLDKGRGPVGTVLVKRGTLKRGDIVVAGGAWGKVRALLNERNEQLADAGPSVPVEILGLDEAPSPGDVFAVVDSEARARELTEYRQRVKREKAQVSGGSVSLVDMMAKLGSKKINELPVVIKSDVQGSGEAIAASLEKMGNDEVRARIVYSGAGGITESDVNLAKSAGAPILGFNVRASKQARDLAEREGVEIRYYSIIYDLLDDMKGVLSGMLAPLQRETFLGNAQVLQVFDISKVGKIAGCRVTEGVVRKGARVRIIRDDVVVLELGVLNTLKRFKDEVNEVPSGQECGMQFQGFQDIKEGDYIECFTVRRSQAHRETGPEPRFRAFFFARRIRHGRSRFAGGGARSLAKTDCPAPQVRWRRLRTGGTVRSSRAGRRFSPNRIAAVKFSALILSAAVAALAAAPAFAADLTIVFPDAAAEGRIMVAVFDSAEAYQAGRPVKAAQLDAAAGETRVTFDDLPDGDYAVRAFHDLNADGRMNTNPFGMPTEPFAFSNNAVGNMGPASWDRARFQAAGSVEQTITLK